jgi:hypothetical protein
LEEKVNLDSDELNNRVMSTMAQIRMMPEFQKKKNEARLQEISRNVTLNTATQLLQQSVFDLLKRIAAGENIDEEADSAKETEEAKETPKKKTTKKAKADSEAKPKKKTTKKAASETADKAEKKPAKKPAKSKKAEADAGSEE